MIFLPLAGREFVRFHGRALCGQEDDHDDPERDRFIRFRSGRLAGEQVVSRPYPFGQGRVLIGAEVENPLANFLAHCPVGWHQRGNLSAAAIGAIMSPSFQNSGCSI
jgi:hypothetical protein